MKKSSIWSYFLFLVVTSNTRAGEFENIGVATLRFFDSDRQRPLVTEMVYPADATSPLEIISDIWKLGLASKKAQIVKGKTKQPLVLFSHGDGGSRIDNLWLPEHLARAGYIVASVDHYGNTWNLHLPKEALKRWDRPKDISFVLRKLLEHKDFGAHIDKTKIGFAGFSLGGLTGIWLVGGRADLFNKPIIGKSSFVEFDYGADQHLIDQIDYTPSKVSYFDPLIKAAFLMAPTYGDAFDEIGLRQIKTPVHIVAGSDDQVVPIEKNSKKFGRLAPKAGIDILPGKVGHFVFLNEPTELGIKTLRKELIQDDPSVNRSKIHEEVANLAIRFFDRHLKQGTKKVNGKTDGPQKGPRH